MGRSNSEFYREQAADTAREAQTIYDPRIRERLRLVEKAWLQLARNALRFEAVNDR